MSEPLFKAADILLPKAGTDLTRWSVVACDQYTSEPEYWEELDAFVGGAPSTLRLILPECLLGTKKEAARKQAIGPMAGAYLKEGLFTCFQNAFIYTLRTLKDGGVRRGLVGAADLLRYDYSKGSRSSIRATEATVLERIPPRMEIRKESPLEFPHVMLLSDDRDDRLFQYLERRRTTYKKVYGFPLSMDSGSIEGYLVDSEGRDFIEGYFTQPDDGTLHIAVGDGNHSLATARACYFERTEGMAEAERLSDPARYALCEIVNLHDETLKFEPIHRAVFGVDADELLKKLNAQHKVAIGAVDGAQVFTLVLAESERVLSILDPSHPLCVGTVQQFLDTLPFGTVDYIHGEDAVRTLAKKGAVGILLPPMEKSDLFPAVEAGGVLPRKTFSMGHAYDKRFYLEGRRIRREGEDE